MEEVEEDSFDARLGAHAGTLPPACRRVAAYIDSNRTSVLASSAMQLAIGAGTSDATVSGPCRRSALPAWAR